MSSDIEKFIKNSVELMEAGLWDEVYSQLDLSDRPTLTQYLWEADIHPELEGLTEIPSHFASALSIESIDLSPLIKSIGEGAFLGCSSLTLITIPNGITTIRDEAFQFCTSLTEITLPNSVTSIGEGAFSDCSSLTEVTIPDNVTSIGSMAFSECSSLTEITIPAGVKTIGELAFQYCTSLKVIIFKGTKEQWRAMMKHPQWCSNGRPLTVKCIDGELRRVIL